MNKITSNTKNCIAIELVNVNESAKKRRFFLFGAEKNCRRQKR